MARALIVEDEKRIATFLQRGLKANGFNATVATDGNFALAIAAVEDFDVIILDLGLPDLDGAQVLRKLRTRNVHTPVIILTARDAVTDKVAGLEAGADDYVTKPFKIEELLARIHARLRAKSAEGTVLQVGDAGLDMHRRVVHVDGRDLQLSHREFALALTFFRHPGEILTREKLLAHVWGTDDDPSSNVVDVYVGALRKKLGAHRIATVRGMGFRLED